MTHPHGLQRMNDTVKEQLTESSLCYSFISEYHFDFPSVRVVFLVLASSLYSLLKVLPILS